MLETLGRKGRLLASLVPFAAALTFIGSSSAQETAPEFIFRMPLTEALPGPGGGAGETNNPRGVVASPDTGHVYVSDLVNNRINEYTAWGLFVKAWGWDVAPEGALGDTATDQLETCGPAVPEADPQRDLCQPGDEGDGRGQLNWPTGLALDGGGNLYVFDRNNRRVQKFSPSGEFLLMFGGDVNRTKVDEAAGLGQRNRCPVDPSDVCQAGTSGEGPSQFDITLGDFVAYSPSPTDAILVGDKGRIQIFNLDGTYRGEIPFEGALDSLFGKQVNGLDIDRDRDIYLSLDGTDDLYKLNAAGEPLNPGKPGASSFDVTEPGGVAVDVEGSVYGIEDPPGSGTFVEARVHKFSSAGEKLLPTEAEVESGEVFPNAPPGAVLTAIATNICAGSDIPGNLYVGIFNAGFPPIVSYVGTFGSAPLGCEPPPPVPPTILEQLATAVGRDDASVRATINPRFFPDTTYYVEYGIGKCSEVGCPSKAPLSPSLLTDKAVSAPIATVGVILEGLLPSTTYHYRFVAQSSGGGPVFGVDPDGAGSEKADVASGVEGSLKTHPAKADRLSCPNDAFRIGPGTDLPDCRAYELVSPLDKGNADVALGVGRSGILSRFFELSQSASSGQRFTFSSATAFANAESAPFSSQYLAERGGAGWTSKSISPPRTQAGLLIDANFSAEFQGFTNDLCHSWLRLFSVAPLVPGAVEKYPNLYRRDNCTGIGTYEPLTTVKPPNRPPDEYVELLIKGFTTDGSHVIFTAPDKLHPDAPAPKTGQVVLYEHADAGLRFVCYLPSGKPITEPCAAGTKAVPGVSDLSSVHNAISADGSRIFWTASNTVANSNPGRIFVRMDRERTVAVSGSVSLEPAFFWTAADDGSKAIFSFVEGPLKGDLYEFDVDSKTPRLIAKGTEGPMGASEDASRIYFASTEDLDGTGQAVAGAHNLYFYEASSDGGGAGSLDFVMALAGRDLGSTAVSSVNPATRAVDFSPATRAARVTPDGLHVTFMSAVAPTPTGFDNRDAATNVAVPEVYRYDAAGGELQCVSCNPTGVRPAARVTEGLLAAGRIEGWEALNHAPKVISENGSRIFFESAEPLVPDDANGTWDVYQWEEPGSGTCTRVRETFSETTGGCVDLISSGQSPVRSVFLDADSRGESVFFGTQSSLVGSDYGLNDVYVARVGGGFPEPGAKGDCEGAACQSPPPPPPTAPSGSEAFRGPGDRVQQRRCPKGKRRVVRKGKVRCIKKRFSKRRKGRRG